MRGIAQQESAALAEMLRHAVMHMIGRKPVDLFNLDLEVLDRPVADILEFQRFGMLGAFIAHRPDQARAASPGHGKDGQEVGLVQIDVQFAIDCRAAGLDIGDIEQLPVGAAGKAGADASRAPCERAPSQPAR